VQASPETVTAATTAGVASPVESAAAVTLRARRPALVHSAWALVLSRLVVWIGGIAGVFLLGANPAGLTPAGLAPLEVSGLILRRWPIGELLVAPAFRWDSGWYYAIAEGGYPVHAGSAYTPKMAFFPLYPVLVAALHSVGLPTITSGIALSLACMFAALYGLHRLTTSEFSWRGRERASQAALMAVMLMAFIPSSLFLSAFYSDGLFAALVVGCLTCARKSRWAPAATLAGLAALTRPNGIALCVPILLFYFYGPREDRAPDRGRKFAPRYRMRTDALWVLLAPLMLGCFCVYIAARGASPLGPFEAQGAWSRSFGGPLSSLWIGLGVGWHGALQAIGLERATIAHPAIEAAGLLFALIAIVGVIATFRLLPVAYGGYMLAMTLGILSYPVTAEPLTSVPRFVLPLVPLYMCGGWWLARRPRTGWVLVALCAIGLAVLSARFAAWKWVA
jgi:hypothetical protein